MIFIGTSGWQYRHWKRVFYPEKLPQKMWLEYYAERFQTVEVNNTFYNLPEMSVFAQWERIAPRDFVFALKMSRYLTHLKRLRDPREPVQRFMERAGALREWRGPVLLQLPPNLEALPDLLVQTLNEFPAEVRIAVEFRNQTWFTSEVAKILEQRGAALCLADSPGRAQPMWRTAPWGYVRFHEGKGRRAPGYERAELVRWVERIAEMWDADEPVFVYFNNDAAGYAIKDAITFAGLAGAAGLRTTRVPSAVAA